MLDLARYEGRKRVRGSLALAVGLSAFAGLYVGLFPSVSEGVDLQAYAETLPPALVQAFGIRALGTIEGFLAAELYSFAWTILLGLYLAYSAAGLVADDVERGRMDVLLALPVTRARVVAEKFASLLVPVLVSNAVVPVAAYAGTVLVADPVSPLDLLAVHALSVPYLLCCAAVGLALSVIADRAAVAQRAALVVLFGLFLLESLVTGTGYAWAGAVAPMRYFDPTAVLVESRYDLAGAALLLAATAALVVASQAYFARRDV